MLTNLKHVVFSLCLLALIAGLGACSNAHVNVSGLKTNVLSYTGRSPNPLNTPNNGAMSYKTISGTSYSGTLRIKNTGFNLQNGQYSFSGKVVVQ